MNPGEAYWLSTPLPGRQGGGRHSSVVLSSAAYNARTGMPVLAAMRRGRPSSYLIAVDPLDFTPRAGQPGLDAGRVIGLDQLHAVRKEQLSFAHGTVDPAPLEKAERLLRRQLQIGLKPWLRRGELWRLHTPTATHSHVVLLLNDKAAADPFMKQTIALPYTTAVQEAPLHMLAKTALAECTGKLSDTEQEQLDAILKGMFDL